MYSIPQVSRFPLQRADEADALCGFFLTASRADAFRILSPTLLSFNNTGDFEQVRHGGLDQVDGSLLSFPSCFKLPLETLALQSNRILFLDHHTRVFIYSGSAVVSREVLRIRI